MTYTEGPDEFDLGHLMGDQIAVSRSELELMAECLQSVVERFEQLFAELP